jgi:hypothetical protein
VGATTVSGASARRRRRKPTGEGISTRWVASPGMGSDSQARGASAAGRGMIKWASIPLRAR